MRRELGWFRCYVQQKIRNKVMLVVRTKRKAEISSSLLMDANNEQVCTCNHLMSLLSNGVIELEDQKGSLERIQSA